MAWWDDLVGGSSGSSDISADTSSDYDIDYDELDRNDSYSPYLDPQEGAKSYQKYQQAYQNYQQAANDYEQNSGWYTDDTTRQNAQSVVNDAEQAYRQAEQNWKESVNNPFFQDQGRAPDYKTTEELNGIPSSVYLHGDESMSGNSMSDAYSSAEQQRRTPNYLSDAIYQSLGINPDTGKGQMDDNDYWQPTWNNDRTWQNTLADTVQQNQTAENDSLLDQRRQKDYFGEPISNEEFAKQATELGSKALDTAGGAVGNLYGFGQNPRTQINLDYVANDVGSLFDQMYSQMVDKEHSSDYDAAIAALQNNIKSQDPLYGGVLYDQVEANLKKALQDVQSGADPAEIRQHILDGVVIHDGVQEETTKALGGTLGTSEQNDGVKGEVKNGTIITADGTQYPEEVLNQPWYMRPIKVVESFGANVANWIVNTGPIKVAEAVNIGSHITHGLDLTAEKRNVYTLANGIFDDPITSGVKAESITQEQWDKISDKDKAILSSQGINSLSQFNSTLRDANHIINDYQAMVNLGEGLREDVLSETKPIREFSDAKMQEAIAGLSTLESQIVQLIPSGAYQILDLWFNTKTGLNKHGEGLLPYLSMGDRVFVDTYTRDRDEGYDHKTSLADAFVNTGLEVGTEMLDGNSVIDRMTYGKHGVFNTGTENIIASIKNPVMQRFVLNITGALGEAVEEDLSQAGSIFADAFKEALAGNGDFWGNVKNNIDEQRIEDYGWAAFSGATLTMVMNGLGDAHSYVSNKRNPLYVAPNIDGTSSAVNPNGQQVYSNSGQRIADINAKAKMEGNEVVKSLYDKAIASGATEEEAIDIARQGFEAGDNIAAEMQKMGDKDAEQVAAEIEAFNSYGKSLLDAGVGDILVDGNNKPVGKVVESNSQGITIKFNEDGHTESVLFGGNRNGGLLDVNSQLGKILSNKGEVTDAETAEIWSKRAEAKAQAAAKAQQSKSAIKPSGNEATDSGTGTPVTQQQSTQGQTRPVPSPIKPSSMEETDSGTSAREPVVADTPAPHQAPKPVGAQQQTQQPEANTPAPHRAPESVGAQTQEEAPQLPNPKAKDLGILSDNELTDRKEQLEEFLHLQEIWGDNTANTQAAREQLEAINAELESRAADAESKPTSESAEEQAPPTPKSEGKQALEEFINERHKEGDSIESKWGNYEYKLVCGRNNLDTGLPTYTLYVKDGDNWKRVKGGLSQDDAVERIRQGVIDTQTSNYAKPTKGRSDIGSAKDNVPSFDGDIGGFGFAMGLDSMSDGRPSHKSNYHGYDYTVEREGSVNNVKGYRAYVENPEQQNASSSNFFSQQIDLGLFSSPEEAAAACIEYLYTHETDENWNKYEDQKRGASESNPTPETGKEAGKALADTGKALEEKAESTTNPLAESAKEATSENAPESFQNPLVQQDNSTSEEAEESVETPPEKLNSDSEEIAEEEQQFTRMTDDEREMLADAIDSIGSLSDAELQEQKQYFEEHRSEFSDEFVLSVDEIFMHEEEIREYKKEELEKLQREIENETRNDQTPYARQALDDITNTDISFDDWMSNHYPDEASSENVKPAKTPYEQNIEEQRLINDYGGTDEYDIITTIRKAESTFRNELYSSFVNSMDGEIGVSDVLSAIELANDVYNDLFDKGAFPDYASVKSHLENELNNAVYRSFTAWTEDEKQRSREYASQLYKLIQHFNEGQSLFNDIFNNGKGMSDLTADNLNTIFDYASVAGEDVINEENKRFQDVNGRESNRETSYFTIGIRASILRQAHLNDQKSETNNALDGTTPVAEDDKGNKLGKNVANFFRNSKLRDAFGRLRTFFHGTNNLEHKSYDYNFADDHLTMWLSSSHETTASYSGTQRQASYFDEEEAKVWTVDRPVVALNEEDKTFVCSEIDELVDWLISARLDPDENWYTQNPAFIDGSVLRSLDVAIQYLTDAKNQIENGISYYDADVNGQPGDIYDFPSEQIGWTIRALNNIPNPSDELSSWFSRLSEICDKVSASEELNKQDVRGKQANVPVYVNSVNPYVIDGKGKRWNRIRIPTEIQNVLDLLGYREHESKEIVGLNLTDDEKESIIKQYSEVLGRVNNEINLGISPRGSIADDPLYSADALRNYLYNFEEAAIKFDLDPIPQTLLENLGDRLSEQTKQDAERILKTIQDGFIKGYTARTRQLAVYAYATGHDSVLIENIVDYAGNADDHGFYIDYDKPSDILAVFSSNQVKDVKNENPTKNDDFRRRQSKESGKHSLTADDELALLDGGSTENTRSLKPESTTTVGNTAYVTDSDSASFYNIKNTEETYQLGEDRLTVDDVEKLTGGEVINRLKAWAKKLGFNGLSGFSKAYGELLTGTKDNTGSNRQIEKSFEEARNVPRSGKVNKQSQNNDYTNRTNLDLAAYEASQTKEGLERERQNAAYMYLQGQDFEAPLQDAVTNLLNLTDEYKRSSVKYIFERIFRNSNIDVKTATVGDAIAALKSTFNEQRESKPVENPNGRYQVYGPPAQRGTYGPWESSGMAAEDEAEIDALISRAYDINIRINNGEFQSLIDVLNGTANLTSSNDSNYKEGDFHGETLYGEHIANIDEDLDRLSEEWNDLHVKDLQSDGDISEDDLNRLYEIEKEMARLESEKTRLQEMQNETESESDNSIRNPLFETDYPSVLAEEDRKSSIAARERNNKPDLGSIKKNNASFIAEQDVPAEHKGKNATGNFKFVRGITINGTTYYALSSEEKGSYRHIMPSSMIERARNILNRLNVAIEQRQKLVDYYTEMGVFDNPYEEGTQEYDTRVREQNKFGKLFNELLDLQEKLDNISNGRYTFLNLWNDKSMPSDLRVPVAGEGEFANFNIYSVSNAISESDAIRSIALMKGESYDGSRTATVRSNQSGNREQSQSGRRNPLIPGRPSSTGGFGVSNAIQHLITGTRESSTDTQTQGTERVNPLLNRRGTEEVGTGTQTGAAAASGYTENSGTQNGRQNNVGVSGSGTVSQRTGNTGTARDTQTVLNDVQNAYSKSFAGIDLKKAIKNKDNETIQKASDNLSKELLKNGYSVTQYRNGRTIIVTDGQRSVSQFSTDDTGKTDRLNSRLSSNANFKAYSAEKIGFIEIDDNGNTTVEMKAGLLVRNRVTGEITLYANDIDSANHELGHDDFALADDNVDERIFNGENVDTLDKQLSDGLKQALTEIGVDYNTLSQYIQSLGYDADEVDEELFAELTAMSYDGSKSEWDGIISISDIAHKLIGNSTFTNLINTIRGHADANISGNINNTIVKSRQDLDQWSDESFDSIINQENQYANEALNGTGNPINDRDFDNLVDTENASEEEIVRGFGSGISPDNTGAFENTIEQENASANQIVNDLSGDGIDYDNEGAFDAYVDEENASAENALNEGAESADRNYPESRFRSAKDYYGSSYEKVIEKVADKHNHNKTRSSFSIPELYYKLHGKSYQSQQNFARLQKLNSNIDGLLKGKQSMYSFNAFIKNMANEQGIAQILNDDIQKEFSIAAKLEERAMDKNASHGDVANFQYAAADAVAHLAARMDMVEKAERARVKLDNLSKQSGKSGNKAAIARAMDAYNRYQITGDNFWRMMGNWDSGSNNEGYALERDHTKSVATKITEEAKFKNYFNSINKKTKQFRDFASGKTMSNVDFGGHKISLMEGIKFVKICDTLRVFASENSRPEWQRVAALGGFAFEGKDGKPIFISIEGSKKNNGSERVKWVRERYDQMMSEIQSNAAAMQYMKACEDMYWEASQDAEKVHARVNGYDRYMYGKGLYTDIHYADKDGKVDFSYRNREATDVHDTGIMQKRTRVNGGYVVVNPMSRSIDAYISQISNYIAFEEFGQKLGVFSDKNSINGSFANTIRDTHGDQYAKWFDNYVKTMTLYRENDPSKIQDKALAKARQAMMTGALVGSVSVPLKQVSSYLDTMGALDPRAVFFAFRPVAKASPKKVNNLIVDSRVQSISDPDYASLFDDNGLLGKFKNTKAGKFLFNATNVMDSRTVANVYRATILDVQFNSGLGKGIYKNGKNFDEGLTAQGQFLVDSKFEQVVLGTQPIFTPQARNELARTDNQILRMFQTFRTQQTQNYNRMLQTWNEHMAAVRNGGDTKATRAKFVQTMSGQLLASASLAALTAIANTILHKHKRYKDDEDEVSEEKVLKRFGLDVFESFMGNSLWVGDITKWMIDMYNSKTDKGWDWKYSNKESQYFSIGDDVHIPIFSSGAIGTALQIVSSWIDLYGNVAENGWTDTNVVSARYLAGNVATAFSLPLNNIYSAMNAGWQWFADGMQLVTGDKKWETKYDDIFTQWARVDNSQNNRLVKAIQNNNQSKIEQMLEDMGEDKFANSVFYGAQDKFIKGDMDKTEYVETLMNFAGKSYKDALKQADKIEKLVNSGISQYNGIDGRDGREAFYNTYADRFPSRDFYKDMFAEIKTKKYSDDHNTYYTTWNGEKSEVSANQSAIIDVLNENIKGKNISYDTAKLLWENYYGYSTSKYQAWQYVGK